MKTRTEAVCQSCGARMPRWVGRCPECDEWGSVTEEIVGASASRAPTLVAVKPEPLAALDLARSERVEIGIEEADRVLGGGIVQGSVVLLAGEPGIGKSTLTLQAAMQLGTRHEVLLVCGEEAPAQVRARAARIGPIPESVQTVADPELPAILGALEASKAGIVIVDSVQTVFDPDIPSAPGSVTQVRECGARLVRAARERGTTIVLVGHVTKEGAIAGPRVLEHLVDVVLSFDGDRTSGMRILRALKNRFGSTQEVGFFDMTSEGLSPIRDASAYLLADRVVGLPGSVLAGCVDGWRPFVCEIQGLVDGKDVASPRRTAIGVDPARLPLIVAVLERHTGVSFAKQDVYVSAVGGIRTFEPATDLAIALALLSSKLGKNVPGDAVAFGELGLAGEVRQATASERRLAEAKSVGCSRAFVPYNFKGRLDNMRLIRLRHVRDALDAFDGS